MAVRGELPSDTRLHPSAGVDTFREYDRGDMTGLDLDRAAVAGDHATGVGHSGTTHRLDPAHAVFELDERSCGRRSFSRGSRGPAP